MGRTDAAVKARWKGTPEERFWAKVQKSDGCWLWSGSRDVLGYGRLWMRKFASTLAHRAAWELTSGPIPAGMTVCHRCDNPPCVRPEHLFLGTQADNVADRDAKGRVATGDRQGRRRQPEAYTRNQPRGMRSPNAKLDETRVREIRRLAAAGWTHAAIAELVVVSDTSVWNVLRGRTWAHVK